MKKETNHNLIKNGFGTMLVIVVIGVIALAAIGIGTYSYLENKGFNNPKGEVPTPTLNNTEDPLPTPEGVEGWKETTIEPRNLYKFQFPNEFEIDNYNPAFTNIKTTDYVSISISERNSDAANFGRYVEDAISSFRESQMNENDVILEDLNWINKDTALFGYYEPGKEASIVAPRRAILVYHNGPEYPMWVRLSAYCQETGYTPVSPFELTLQDECTTRSYSDLRQLILDISSTIKPV